MRNRKVLWGLVALGLVAVVVTVFVVNARRSGVEISTATAKKGSLAVSVSASGRVEADTRADVYPVTGGTLKMVFVKDGQAVKAGDALALLDEAPLELQLEQAEAAHAQAEAQIVQARTSAPTGADRTAADANVTAARAQVSAAASSYNSTLKATRAKLPPSSPIAAIPPLPSNPASITPELVQQEIAILTQQVSAAIVAGQTGAASQQAQQQVQSAKSQLSQAAAQVKQAVAGLRQAEAQRDKLSSEASRAARKAALAARDQADEAIEIAENNLAKAKMVAPIDGIVIFNPLGSPSQDGAAPKAQPGAAVAPQAPPFTIIQLGALRFSADVDEVDIDKVRVGQSASISLDAFPSDTLSSTVTAIKSVSTQTSTGGNVFPVFVQLQNVAKGLRIGMKGDATIEVSAIRNAITVPIDAVLDDNGQSYVFLVEGETLKRRDVEVGALTLTRVEVRDGLEAGDVVALGGEEPLKEGMRVRVK